MPKIMVTTNDGRVIADFEIGDVDPVDYQPEIDEVLREAFELEGAPNPGWLQSDDVGPGIRSTSTVARGDGPPMGERSWARLTIESQVADVLAGRVAVARAGPQRPMPRGPTATSRLTGRPLRRFDVS